MKAGGKYDPWYKTHEDYRSLVYFWRCETYDSLLYHFKLIKGNVWISKHVDPPLHSYTIGGTKNLHERSLKNNLCYGAVVPLQNTIKCFYGYTRLS